MVKKRFEQRLYSLASELWTKIAQIDELKGQWDAGIQLSSRVLGRLKRSILITSAGERLALKQLDYLMRP